ncbi:MAG: hypothetical protein IPL79_09535 [Myxococcales bacterium]|nr:hypothetical protein [Myxococcales bacterium]
MAEATIDQLEAGLSEDERALLDQLADGIAQRRLTTAAIFFVESVKPLEQATSQLMLFFRPIVTAIWSDPVRWDLAQAILERRGSLELLLRRLEARA